MKGLKLRSFVIFALAAIAGAALLHTSQRVQHAEDRLSNLRADIAREQDAIRVLKAEWEYLNRPERLEKLAAEFLNLVPPSPDTMPDDMLEQAAELPDMQTKDEPQIHPAFFEQQQQIPQAIPRPKSKPITTRIKKPEKPRPIQTAEPVKAFDTLLDEIGGTP